MRLSVILAAAALTALAPAAWAFPGIAPTSTDKTVIVSAEMAAPKSVAQSATIVAFDHKGTMRVLRQGTNNFTCMPDDPTTPGIDPICVDANGLDWLVALAANKTPTPGKVGMGYMLAGGSDASNLDPYASAPPDGGKWISTGPHIVILNIGGEMVGYPEKQASPDVTQPFVMYAGTAYARLMVPTK